MSGAVLTVLGPPNDRGEDSDELVALTDYRIVLFSEKTGGANDAQSPAALLQLPKNDLLFRECIAGARPVIGFFVIGSRGGSGAEDLSRKFTRDEAPRVQKLRDSNDQ